MIKESSSRPPSPTPSSRPSGRAKSRWNLWNVLFAIVLVALGMGYYFFTRTHVGKTMAAVAEVWASPDLIFGHGNRVTLLFLGTDVDRDNRGRVLNTFARTDTIMVVSLDRTTRQVSLLSVPRDTGAHIPGHGYTKINAAHAFGGPQLLMETLREDFCLNVDHYVRTKFEGFMHIVDAIGGVDLEVEKDMDYDDNWGNLHIHLRKGMQHLDGKTAHAYARFRHDRTGDIGRIARQQHLVSAVVSKLLSDPMMALRLPQIAEAVSRSVETDLSTGQLMSLASFMRSVSKENLTTALLPGSVGTGYWVTVPGKAKPLLESLFGEAFDSYRWDAEVVAKLIPSGKKAGAGASVPTVEIQLEQTEPPLESIDVIPPSLRTEPATSSGAESKGATASDSSQPSASKSKGQGDPSTGRPSGTKVPAPEDEEPPPAAE